MAAVLEHLDLEGLALGTVAPERPGRERRRLRVGRGDGHAASAAVDLEGVEAPFAPAGLEGRHRVSRKLGRGGGHGLRLVERLIEDPPLGAILDGASLDDDLAHGRREPPIDRALEQAGR